jgi:hypothetical protein
MLSRHPLHQMKGDRRFEVEIPQTQMIESSVAINTRHRSQIIRSLVSMRPCVTERTLSCIPSRWKCAPAPWALLISLPSSPQQVPRPSSCMHIWLLYKATAAISTVNGDQSAIRLPKLHFCVLRLAAPATASHPPEHHHRHVACIGSKIPMFRPIDTNTTFQIIRGNFICDNRSLNTCVLLFSTILSSCRCFFKPPKLQLSPQLKQTSTHPAQICLLVPPHRITPLNGHTNQAYNPLKATTPTST